MLGSINTGGFSKSQVDAMRDSNYFNRKGVKGVYNPINPNAPVVTGSPDFLQSFISKMPQLGTDEKGKSFVDRFQSYRPKEETGQEKFYGQLADKLDSGKGFAVDAAEGFTVVDKPKGQPMVVGGTPGQPGFVERYGIPVLSAFLSEVNDVLSDCAYFVKNLNECS
jgi:hypothetical protein